MNDNDDKPTLDELPGLLAVELATVGRALSSVSRDIICGILDDAVGRAKAAEAESARLRDENAEAWHAFDRQQDRGDRLAARVTELETRIAQGAFVTDRRPPDGTEVEVLLLGQWEPGIVPEARGRWRDRRYETLSGVQGWRPVAEEPTP